MGGGSGGGSSTTVQKADPWVGVQPYLVSGYQHLSDLYTGSQRPQYYQGQQVATPNWMEQSGQQDMIAQLPGMNAAGQQAAASVGGLTNQGFLGAAHGLPGATNAMNYMSGMAPQLGAYGTSGALQGMNQLLGAGDVTNNPYLQSAMQAAIRPVTQQFTEQVMPGIKQGAIGAGQMGSSRQGVAEGIASRGYMDTVADMTAQMGSQAYGQGLQAVQAGAGIGQGLLGAGLGAASGAGQLGSGLFSEGLTGLGRAAALAPGAQQALAMPGQMVEQIGQQYTADQQAQINADMAKWNYEQQLPYSMLSDYMSLLQGAPGGQTSSNMKQSGGGSSPIISGLGGAATGAGLASALGLAGPWGWGAAALGGALGLFG